jgi:hypothetical protein
MVGLDKLLPLKRTLYTSDAAVQTDSSILENESDPHEIRQTLRYGTVDNMDGGDMSTLSASDLTSILKWSQEISRDINLASGMIASCNYCKYH